MESRPEALVEGRWTGVWTRLGARRNAASVFNQLIAAYAEPGRAYHNAAHIRDCLTQFDLSRGAAARPDELEAALWFHDAVYVPARNDNEDRSARLAEQSLSEAEVSLDIARRVAGLVIATRHDTIPNEPDAQLMCDIDLSILGRDPPAFDEFERNIRKEYSWVPEVVYRASRAQILSGFLERPTIYQTRHFRERYEIPARANLKRLICALQRSS